MTTSITSTPLPVQQKRFKRWLSIHSILWLAPAVTLVAMLCLGRFAIDPITIIKILLSTLFPIEPDWLAVKETIVLNVRLPRLIMAMLIGGGLAMAGAAFQGLFGNPLVSPHILGVSSGAGFGAALSILFVGTLALVPVAALVFGLLAMLAALWVSRSQNSSLFMLILAGVITAALFDALTALLKYMADPNDTLPTIVYWLMGSLASASWSNMAMGAPLLLIGMGVLMALRWQLNVLSLSDQEARSLGVNVKRLRWIIIVAGTMITAAAVSMAGIVGWVGLVIPHLARMIVGAEHKKLIPASMLLGASYLMLVDSLARTLSTAEIPLSILTAVIGAPFFAYLLKRKKGGWS